MVNFVEDPRLVIIHRIVLDSLPSMLGRESVDNLNLVKFDHDTAFCSAGDVVYFVSLDCHLHFFVGGHEGGFDVPAWLGGALHNSTPRKVHTYMAFPYLVQPHWNDCEDSHG